MDSAPLAGLVLDDARAVRRWALVSDDGLYRYELGRTWGRSWVEGGRRIVWVMLNPSTADADIDDPTIRRCVGFSKAWGYDELAVVNLYAYRATDPKALSEAVGAGVDIVGEHNVNFIDHHLSVASVVVAAWGAHPWASKVADSVLTVAPMLMCLGTTKDGHPRHPLYVRGDQPLEVWRA